MSDRKRRDGILLDDKYAVVTMPIDYALAKIMTDKDGSQYFKPFLFYGSVEKCLQAYIRESVHDGLSVETSISLDEAVKRIATACDRCHTAISNAFPSYKVVKE